MHLNRRCFNTPPWFRYLTCGVINVGSYERERQAVLRTIRQKIETRGKATFTSLIDAKDLQDAAESKEEDDGKGGEPLRSMVSRIGASGRKAVAVFVAATEHRSGRMIEIFV